MNGRIGCRLLQGCISTWMSSLVRISVLFLLLSLLGCETIKSHIPYFKKDEAPVNAEPVEDPALSVDPGKSPKGPLQWTWHDPEQRWDYTRKIAPVPALQMDGWIFDPAALQLRIVASPQLNSYQNRPHSMVLRIFQLSDPKAFQDRRGLSFGLQEMLKNDTFDPTVLSVTQFALVPGADQTVSMDRQLNVRYLAVVAGYFGLDGKQVARMVPVPVIDDSVKGNSWLFKLSMGYFGKEETTVPPRPAKLKLVLKLGVEKIDELRVFAQ